MNLPKWIRRLARDPTIHFVVIGGLAALAVHQFGAAQEREIVVSASRIEQIEQAYKAQFGTLPTPERLDWLIEDFVNTEMLSREAVHQGLDKDDEVVKRRLVQKMQFLVEGTADEPSDSTLRAYYGQHLGDYVRAAGVTLSHAFFADRPDKQSAQRKAEFCSKSLAKPELHNDPAKACPGADTAAFPGPSRFENADRAALVRVFGDTEVVAAALGLPVGGVSKPVRSAYGWHVLSVSSRTEGQNLPFAQVRNKVREDWIAAELAANQRKAMQDLRSRYSVRREDR